MLDAIICFQKPYLQLFIQFGDMLSHPRAHVREVEKEISQRISEMLNVAGSIAGYNTHMCPSFGDGGGIMGGYLIFKVTARLVPGIFKNQNQRTGQLQLFETLRYMWIYIYISW
jgi:hypothetical protein